MIKFCLYLCFYYTCIAKIDSQRKIFVMTGLLRTSRKCLTQDLKLDNSNSLEITIVKLAKVLHKMLLCVCLGIVQKLRAGVKVSKGSDSDTVWGMKLGL